jgi:hypothetical protein
VHEIVTQFYHPTVQGIITVEHLDNQSMFRHTVVGDLFCITYNPSAKTDMTEVDTHMPYAMVRNANDTTNCIARFFTLKIQMYVNTTNIPIWLTYIHDKSMTTLDYGGRNVMYDANINH